MPERKIELIGPGFKIHSVTGNNPKIIEADSRDRPILEYKQKHSPTPV
jgi:hypothetical protein